MLYRLFSSLKTSVYILSFMGIIFLIGTIFPQGNDIGDYIEAGGGYVALVRTLDFLDIFMSPLFIFVTGFLLINLTVCIYDRLKIFLRFKRKLMDFERLKHHENIITLENNLPSPLPTGQAGPFVKGGKGGFDIEDRLRSIGFKVKTEAQDGVKICEKGLQYWWLSWFYHVGIILSISGFFLTALFAVEKDVILYPGKPETISVYSKNTRWNQFLSNLGIKLPEESEEDEYVLALKEFRTEYYQGLRIDYPENKVKRLILGLGIEKIKPSEKGFSYMPKMWLTRLDVKKPDGRVLDAELWVNKPFRTGSLTLYQMGYEEKAELFIRSADNRARPELFKSGKGETIDVEAGVPFQVKDLKGKFVLSSLKLGTLFRRDKKTEKITPFTTVYYIPEDNPSEREELGEIRLGGNLKARGVYFEFRDYKDASYLSYRKDPGVWLVGFACLFVFLGLFVRSLGAWYRVQYAVDDKTTYILISTRGILADKDRIIRKLRK